MKSIDIEYYAILREQRGLSSETVQTTADTA
ncbi:MAG TPA: molybdopterin synthase sulfur carrier subunit, partial [Candidatus Hydrogenedentes bacterium]|nr:molybdopterin synthase sulfur carrier subunit [Candidatus Hydrogenedentota bacterium]